MEIRRLLSLYMSEKRGKIPVSSPDYQKWRGEAQERNERKLLPRFVFGGEVEHKDAASIFPYQEANLRKQWGNVFQKPTLPGIRRVPIEDPRTRLIVESVNDPAVRKEFIHRFPWIGSEEALLADTANFASQIGYTLMTEHTLLAAELPLPLILAMTKQHIKHFRLRQKEFKKDILPPLLDELTEKIGTAVDQRILPLSKERWQNAIGRAHISLFDQLIVHREYPSFDKDVAGQRIPESLIYLGDDIPAEKVLEVLLHEMMHEMEGRTIRETGEDEVDPRYRFDEQRGGLAFHVTAGSFITQRFRWLNEAITVYATYLVLQKKSILERGYKDEVSILLILKTEVPIDIFLRAYFEDYVPSKTTGVPDWKKLMQTLNQCFGPKFLLRLDQFIGQQQDHVAEALALMRKPKKEIQKTLKNWDEQTREEIKKEITEERLWGEMEDNEKNDNT